MFTVSALYPFSPLTLKQQEASQKQQKQPEQNNVKQKSAQDQSQEINQKQEQGSEIQYLTFEKGDQILVIQSYQNGWWYGNKLKEPQTKGFFPSNYVQVSSKPKPPPPPPQDMPEQSQLQGQMYDINEDQGIDWVQNQLKNVTKGPVKSDYYLGIKGYKNVKIDDKNQNILKGDHVKFDVSTGLAKVPVKDQAPAAKAVRQMGYYFDYHEWVQDRNKQPGQYKARPDPKKKKIKKLNLKGMK